ncbi:MAG: branched-chain amino acid ABC transporter permease [Candidatus Saccharibacteria bacterium]
MEALLEQYIDIYYLQILVFIGINIVLALGLNLVTGYTGQLSMGHAGFMSIGAYTSAILALQYGLPFWVCFAAAGLMAGLFGIALGIPILRLDGDYLAMVTIGFAEIVRVVLLNLDIAGGGLSLSGIPNDSNFVVVWTVVLLVIAANAVLKKTRHGKAMIAIREDEIAAAASGINTTYYKVLAFALGACLAGFGGSLYAHYMTAMNPEVFSFTKSVEILSMVVLGGMGSIPGTILGAIVLTILPETLRFVSDYRLLFFGGLLVLMMNFRPDGILGGVRWHDIKQYFKRRASVQQELKQ